MSFHRIPETGKHTMLKMMVNKFMPTDIGMDYNGKVDEETALKAELTKMGQEEKAFLGIEGIKRKAQQDAVRENIRRIIDRQNGGLKRFNGHLRNSTERVHKMPDGSTMKGPIHPGAIPGSERRVVDVPFDPEGSGYDYQEAKRHGIKPALGPDGKMHWPSRARSGQLLKGRRHKTWDLLEAGEEKAGYEIYKGKDGKYFSRPKVAK